MDNSIGEKRAGILIAEDDPVSRRLLTANLEKWDFRVIVTRDGNECLEAFRSDNSIRVAILDWMMPGLEGPDVCRQIKDTQDRPFVYVMMLTALTEKSNIVKALSTGADDYLSKPFEASELEARIRAGLRVVELETSLRQKIADLTEALEHIEQLKGILPICAWCSKIRDDSDYWSSVEEYFEAHSRTRFSHSICPTCMADKEGERASR